MNSVIEENIEIAREFVACDLCGSTEHKLRYKKPDFKVNPDDFEYPVVECTRCGLVFVNPRPTMESMRHYYVQGYHENRNTDAHRRRYQAQLGFLPPLSRQRILDIGCARGDFLAFLKKRHPEVEAVGIDFFCQKVDDDSIEFYQVDLAHNHFGDEEFDIITAWAVFEHVHQPGLYFQKVNRILKPNGKFVFLVTNSESLFSRRAYREDIPRHTYHFSEKTLHQYARKFGFEFTRCAYDNTIYEGRGKGTFRYTFGKMAGATVSQIQANDFRNKLQKRACKLGVWLDRIVFKGDWECWLKRSGMIVVEFTKA